MVDNTLLGALTFGDAPVVLLHVSVLYSVSVRHFLSFWAMVRSPHKLSNAFSSQVV